MARLSRDPGEKFETMQRGVQIPLAAVTIVSRFGQIEGCPDACQVERRGVTWGIGLMIVDECAAFLLLPLEQPISNFKNKIRKLRVALNPRPGAEGLHQP